MRTAFIALGSNLGDPKTNISKAVELLAKDSEIIIVAKSDLYGSTAVGPGEQPDYVNGAVKVETSLEAEALLDLIQGIERELGRERSVTWAARTIDLDILWFNNETIRSRRLVVPHPRICERNFVLLPLNDIAPDLELNGESIANRARDISRKGIWKLQATEF